MSQFLKDKIASNIEIALLESSYKKPKKVIEAEDEESDEDEDKDAIEEMSVRRAATIGAVVGGPVGALYGAMFAKGKQRTLDDSIKAAEKKVQDWSKDPKNKEKIEKKRQQINKWKRELIELKQKGKGESGAARTKMATIDRNRDTLKK